MICRFTGRHMLLIMLAFFGTVIAVNILMATLASRSFTGLLAVNGYVASIDYAADEAERQAASRLGWTIRVAAPGGVPEVSVTDAAGRPVALSGATATVEAANRGEPAPLALTREGALVRGDAPLEPGNWVIRAKVVAAADAVTKRAVVSVR
jgi:nitrogen fixation protein FixH